MKTKYRRKKMKTYFPRFVVPKNMASKVYPSKKDKAKRQRIKRVDIEN